MRKNLNKIFSFISVLSLLLANLATAQAAILIAASDKQSTIKASTLSNHDISITTKTAMTASQTVVIDFSTTTSIAAGFAVTDVDVLINGSSTAVASAAAAGTWGAARTSATKLTLTAPTDASYPATTTVRVKIGNNASLGGNGVNIITNSNYSSTTQFYKLTLSNGDIGTIGVPILQNDSVRITAFVPYAISLNISTNTLYFGDLSNSATKYAIGHSIDGETTATVGNSLIVKSNVPGGYSMTMLGDTLRHTSSTTATITGLGYSSTALSAGTEQFGLNITSTSTGMTIATPFATAGQYAFGASTSTDVIVASSSNTTDGHIYNVNYAANMAGTTDAGWYQTDITYVVTGNY